MIIGSAANCTRLWLFVVAARSKSTDASLFCLGRDSTKSSCADSPLIDSCHGIAAQHGLLRTNIQMLDLDKLSFEDDRMPDGVLRAILAVGDLSPFAHSVVNLFYVANLNHAMIRSEVGPSSGKSYLSFRASQCIKFDLLSLPYSFFIVNVGVELFPTHLIRCVPH